MGKRETGIVVGVLIVLGILFFIVFGTRTDKETRVLPTASKDSTDAAFTIVAFGDSITAGYGIDLDSAYPAVLERALRTRGYDVSVLNAGVSGETTAGGLRRASFVAEQEPDMVILALGGNDVLRGIEPSSTERNLRDMVELFQNEGIVVVLVGMQAPFNLGPQYVQQFNTIYKNIAKEFDTPFVPFLLKDVALVRELNQNDDIHPNEAGARIIAEENILPVVVKELEELL